MSEGYWQNGVWMIVDDDQQTLDFDEEKTKEYSFPTRELACCPRCGKPAYVGILFVECGFCQGKTR